MKALKKSVKTRLQGFELLGIGIIAYHAGSGAALILIGIASLIIICKEV